MENWFQKLFINEAKSALQNKNVAGPGSGGDLEGVFDGTATDVTLPNVTSLREYAFYHYEYLVTLNAPKLKTIGNYAFLNCFSLAMTALPEGITSIGESAFQSCINLPITSLPEGLTVIPTHAFNGCSKLALTSLPEGMTTIGSQAFMGCPKLALTSLPAGITSIGYRAFRSCTGLTAITFKGTPTTIDSTAFSSCSNLTTINVPWAEGAVAGAPWGATNATINYNYTEG